MSDKDKTKAELRKENAWLRKQLEKTVAHGWSHDPQQVHAEDVGILLEKISHAGMAVARLQDEAEFFRLVGKTLHEVLGGCALMVNRHDSTTHRVKIQCLCAPSQFRDALIEGLGGDLEKKTALLPTELHRLLLKGGLLRIPDGLYGMLLGQYDKAICRDIEKALSLGELYAVGLSHQDTLFGTVILIPTVDQQLPYPRVVEAATHHFSLAFQRFLDVQALRQNEQRYRLITAKVKDVIWTMSLDARFTYVSPSIEGMTGYRAAEVEGRFLKDFTPARDYENARQGIQRLIESGMPQSKHPLEMQMRRKDGSLGWFEVSTSVLYDAQGRPETLLGVTREITARRQLENELARKGKLESIGLLAGGIAHDFNNLLTTVLGNVSVLQKRYRHTLEADGYKRVAHAAQACQKARKLTQQLLTFSRGGAPIRTPYHPGTLLWEATEFTLSSTAVARRYNLADDLWAICVDRSQIEQVLQNLLLNASHAMNGGGTLMITARNLSVGKKDSDILEPGHYVEMTIRDHGVGIPDADLDKVFDPYFSTKPHGTGLGLTIAYSIVKRHNGHLTIDCPADGGTRVKLILPASPSCTHQEMALGQPKLVSYPALMPEGEKHILVMDDDPDVREVVELLLVELGYSVHSVADGHRAIDAYRRALEADAPFDAVIMDLIVPEGMGGRQTAQKLLEIDPAARLIVASGYSDDPVMAAHEDHGFSALLVKPFDLVELAEALAQIFQSPADRVS